MASSPSAPEQLAQSLKAVLYPPEPGQWADAPKAIKKFVNVCRKTPAGDPLLQRCVGEMSCHLLTLATSTSTPSLVTICLRGFLNIGRIGWLAAVRFIRSGAMALPVLTAMVKGLPERERLFLLHEMFRRPHEMDAQLTAWAKDLLAPLSKADPMEVLQFLRGLGLIGDSPSFAVREAVMAGEFRAWITNLLGGSLSDKSLEGVSLAVKALEDEALVEKLGGHVHVNDPEQAARVLAIVSTRGYRGGEKLERIVLGLLKKAEGDVVMDCVDALIRLRSPRVGRIMAVLFKRDGSLRRRLSVRLPMVNEAAFRQFIEGLNEKERSFVYAYTFAVVARLEPGYAPAAMARVADGKGKPLLKGKAAKAMKEFLAAQAAKPLFPLEERAGDGRGRTGAGPVGGGKSRKKCKLVDSVKSLGEADKADFSGECLAGVKVAAGKGFRNSDFTRTSLSKVAFSRSAFSNVRFDKAAIKECVFTGCTFFNCRFAGAAIGKSRFNDCRFEGCDLGRAEFRGTHFIKTSLERCFMSEAVFDACGFSFTSARVVSLSTARFKDSVMKSSRLEACDFSSTVLLDSFFSGVEFIDCVFDHTLVKRCDFPESGLAGCTLADCVLRQVWSTDPELMAAAEESRFLALEVLKKDRNLTVPEAVQGEEGREFMARAVDLWLRHREIAGFEHIMLANNVRRTGMALRKMDAAAREFYTLAPYLLHTDVFETALGIEGVPGCRVELYEPDYTTLELIRKRFPKARPGKPGKNPVSIQAVYTIGSIGSIAQSADSDVDYWVCIDGQGVEQEAMDGLKRKLDALTDWADKEFGVEAYFFLMTLENVRANNFGLSDKESSGSAQALLLKEEFYRSAVRVAGRLPAWWVTPPGFDRDAYNEYLEAALCHPLGRDPRVVDMGGLSSVPPEEFFGASLWQIVKAIKSPYKSVMKLGLLEKYAGYLEKGGLLLCDRIKENLMGRRRAVQYVDPYTALFRELTGYYGGVGDRDAVELVKEAFLLKAHLSEMGLDEERPTGFEEKSLAEYLFNEAGLDPILCSAPDRKTFESTLASGQMVNRFMVSTYNRIQERLAGGDAPASANITPEDLTKLGRKIFTAVAQKKDKVERLPFFDTGEHYFDELVFAAVKAPGRKTRWTVKGRQAGAKVSREKMPEIRREFDPVKLFAWIVANNLWKKGAMIDCERTMSPVAAADVQRLLSEMAAFFPQKKCFDIAPEEYLQPERVTRAFIVLNLPVQRSARAIQSASVVYATNWGEMFCKTVANPPQKNTVQAGVFVKKTLEQPVPKVPEMAMFLPKACRCPRMPLI